MDKAGNAYGGGRIAKAADGLGPNLSLSESGDLSKEKVTVTINTDEQLASLPTVNAEPCHQQTTATWSTTETLQCVYPAVEADTDVTPRDRSCPSGSDGACHGRRWHVIRVPTGCGRQTVNDPLRNRRLYRD